MFLIKQIGIIIPFLILIWLLVKKIKFNLNFKDKNLLFLLAINILPIVLIFLTSLITGSKIRTMWMTPFYLFFGTLFVYLLQKQIIQKKLKPFLIGFIFCFFLVRFTHAVAPHMYTTSTHTLTEFRSWKLSHTMRKLVLHTQREKE